MRAVAELRELKMRPQQGVADFCVAMEKLGRKAYPDSTGGDWSLEFAYILLSNLKSWPEHVQLLSALHRVRPDHAYEEVKQLALSIESSKAIYGGRSAERWENKKQALSYQSWKGEKFRMEGKVFRE
ncbi:unnamed protein product [Nippostrongylus brasiliensis]|uniref:Transposase n=1 Tax=Nippostrongylus brasiliensis TaxID=27835 RepID=A0A0N4Y6U3_NIPBR|nr:unnamed protein product [Nippostrongylus brasiliensis]